MINQHLTRQSDLIPSSILNTPITVIGAGAIGSWVTLALAKTGFSDLTVYDNDVVDIVNMNSQMYGLKDIGRAKVNALGDIVSSFTGISIKAKPQFYSTGIFSGIVIAAVDSMAARKLIWTNHKDKAPFTQAIIDPRMGAESALLFAMNPMSGKDAEAYEASLYSDDSALQERCTAKATTYCALMLSGLVVKSVKDLLTRPDYLRTAQWDIKNNDFLGFSKKP